jgi:hypothetical protein
MRRSARHFGFATLFAFWLGGESRSIWPANRKVTPGRLCMTRLGQDLEQARRAKTGRCVQQETGDLEYAVALHFNQYNFIRRSQTLRVTLARAAKVTHHLWSLEQLVRMIDGELPY